MVDSPPTRSSHVVIEAALQDSDPFPHPLSCLIAFLYFFIVMGCLILPKTAQDTSPYLEDDNHDQITSHGDGQGSCLLGSTDECFEADMPSKELLAVGEPPAFCRIDMPGAWPLDEDATPEHEPTGVEARLDEGLTDYASTGEVVRFASTPSPTGGDHAHADASSRPEPDERPDYKVQDFYNHCTFDQQAYITSTLHRILNQGYAEGYAEGYARGCEKMKERMEAQHAAESNALVEMYEEAIRLKDEAYGEMARERDKATEAYEQEADEVSRLKEELSQRVQYTTVEDLTGSLASLSLDDGSSFSTEPQSPHPSDELSSISLGTPPSAPLVPPIRDPPQVIQDEEDDPYDVSLPPSSVDSEAGSEDNAPQEGILSAHVATIEPQPALSFGQSAPQLALSTSLVAHRSGFAESAKQPRAPSNLSALPGASNGQDSPEAQQSTTWQTPLAVLGISNPTTLQPLTALPSDGDSNVWHSTQMQAQADDMMEVEACQGGSDALVLVADESVDTPMSDSSAWATSEDEDTPMTGTGPLGETSRTRARLVQWYKQPAKQRRRRDRRLDDVLSPRKCSKVGPKPMYRSQFLARLRRKEAPVGRTRPLRVDRPNHPSRQFAEALARYCQDQEAMDLS
ncbi:MAG: hypothetical protein LQ338_003541 [Usnochroma carphineum]|nr:MAG: hypothetical protein LQ338_003541 [Usnochroma carphineum]